MKLTLAISGAILSVLFTATLSWHGATSGPDTSHNEVRSSAMSATPTDGDTLIPAPSLPDLPLQASESFAKQTVRDRFPHAEVLASRITHLDDGVSERIRIVRDGATDRRIRLTEHVRAGTESKQEDLLYQGAMLADRIVVSVDSDHALANLLTFLNTYDDYTFVEKDASTRIFQIKILDAATGIRQEDLDAALNAVDLFDEVDLPGVVAGPDHLYFPLNEPDDPDYFRQWGLPRIDAPDAWNITTGSNEVYVAVVDSGADLEHPDLFDNIAHEHARDFVDRGTPPNDMTGHGTRVTGILGAAGDNGIGIAGVNWTIRMIPLRTGDETFSTELLAEALDYVTELRLQGVPVVATNNSYGIDEQSRPVQNRIDRLLGDAIERSRDAGILFVAAAGNNGWDMDSGTKSYPAAYDYDNIISVASTTRFDNLATSSNYGGTIVHLGAPGQTIYSTTRNGSYVSGSGTSFAAPFVTGALALMKAANPELEPSELKTLLLDTVDPLPSLEGKTITGGRLNLGRAVRAAAPESVELPVLFIEAERHTIPQSPLFQTSIHVLSDRVLETDLSVHLQTGGSAVSGEDYSQVPEFVIIPAGENRATFILEPILPSDDTQEEKVLDLSLPDSGEYLVDSDGIQIHLKPHTFRTWKGFYFGPEAYPLDESAVFNDPAGDGFPNLVKYALGLAPLVPVYPRDATAPALERVALGDNDYAALSFERPVGLDDIEYRVEASNSLDAESWESASTVVHDIVTLGDGTERVVFRDEHPIQSDGSRFLRLRIVVVESFSED